MGIRFSCSHCGHELNVKSHLAGKRARCPKCDGRLTIPTELQDRQSSTTNQAQGIDAVVVPAINTAATQSSKSSGLPTPARPSNAAQIQIPELPNNPTTTSSFSLSHPNQTGAAVHANAFDALDEIPEAVWYVRPPSGGQFGPASRDLMKRWLSEERVTADSHVWREGWPDWKSAADVFSRVFEMPRTDINTITPQKGISRSLASQKLYMKRKKRRRTVGVVIILIGVVLIIALIIVLLMVLNKS
jgi:hypothetical protein